MRASMIFTLATTLVASGIGGGMALAAGGGSTDRVVGRYWVDFGSPREFTPGAFEVDAKNLSIGLHSIHSYVATDSSGLSSVVSRWFVKTPLTGAGGDCKVMVGLDGKPLTVESVPAIGGATALTLDVATLAEGLHYLHTYVESADGILSSTSSRWFLKTPSVNVTDATVMLAVDGDQYAQQSVSQAGAVIDLEADFSSLSDGLHCLQGYVKYGKGVNSVLSSAFSRWFMKAPIVNDSVEYRSVVYVDGNELSTAAVSPTGGVFALDLDCLSLPIGFHMVSAQIVSPTGVPTAIGNSIFYRTPVKSELAAVKGYYVVDGVRKGSVDFSDSGELCRLLLDVNELTNGIHSIALFLSDGNSLTTSPLTAWFVKCPEGGNRIAGYEYWLNDDYETRRSVELPTPVNPFELSADLEVDEQPLCSRRYAFAVVDGQPTVYGKNNFEMRFKDVDNRMSSARGSFVDVRVKELLTNVPVIANGRTTIEELPENRIKWYCYAGRGGDSISVKLDREGMIELYSPSGDLIYAADSAASTVYAPVELDEYGYYWLAVHDVAADRRKNVGVDFLSIRGVLVGDADDNGVVDANDVVVIRNYYLNKSDRINKDASDVNADGVIDAQNALTTRIIYLATLIEAKQHKQSRCIVVK